MTAALVIASAVLGSTALFALWDWACRRVIAHQDRRLDRERR